MLLLREPKTEEKIALLGRAACYDLHGAEERGGPASDAGRRVAEELGRHLYRPAARVSAPLLKVLLTDACHRNCLYCAFRAGLQRPRTSFRPEELAGAFIEMYRRGHASGLFLSSGLAGNPARTMEAMLRTGEILRRRHRFPGYLHLKVLPGATDDYLEAACRLADRVSANLEAPNPARLAAICPEKQFHADLEDPLRRIAEIRRREGSVSFGTTTQFVVGAAGESDGEILETVGRLYAEADLTRAHFSAFRPVPDTPLEDRPAVPEARQLRLYQADSLLRGYGFSVAELPLEPDGNLPAGRDPKLEWALRHPERFPVEVNRASREELLRVPGLGPRAADAVLRARRSGRISGLAELKRFPLVLARAAPFLLVGGRRPAREEMVQLPLGLEPDVGAEAP